jgi:hypothetical protein
VVIGCIPQSLTKFARIQQPGDSANPVITNSAPQVPEACAVADVRVREQVDLMIPPLALGAEITSPDQ